MSVVDSSGTVLTKSALLAKCSAGTTETPYTVNENIYEMFTLPGKKDFEGDRRLLFYEGQVVLASKIDAIYEASAASVDSITPATGPAAGGTVVTIKGSGFGGATGVTFGGTAGTAFDVVDNETIKVTTPAKTAGAYNVVVQDASGNVTVTNGYTYS